MIDMLHSDGKTISLPKQTSVTYTLSPSLSKGATPIDNGPGSLPSEIKLEQNYPNPFNPTTNIGFSLNKSMIVSLKIYDIIGRLVSTPLVNKTLSAGDHNIIFSGSNLSSGVYIYRLTAGKNTYTQKMLLIK